MSIGSERSDPGRVDGNADSGERRAIVEMAADFAAREIAPRVADYDREEELPTRSARQDGRARPLRRGHTRRARRASGLDFVTFVDLIEEIIQDLPDPRHPGLDAVRPGRSRASSASAPHEQKERWLRPLAQGEIFGAAAVTEPGSGSDVAGIDHDLPARRRRFRAQRRQGLDLEPRHRLVLRHVRELRPLAAPRAASPRSSSRATRPGLSLHPYKDKLGLPAALHGRGRARRRPPRPRRAARRRGRRLQRRDDRRRARTPRRRRARGRRRAGVPRGLGCLRARPRPRSAGRSRSSSSSSRRSRDMAVGATTARLLVVACAEALGRGERARVAHEHGEDVRLGRRRSARLPTRCRSTARPACRPSTASAACTATPRSCRSSRAATICTASLIGEIELGLRRNGES